MHCGQADLFKILISASAEVRTLTVNHFSVAVDADLHGLKRRERVLGIEIDRHWTHVAILIKLLQDNHETAIPQRDLAQLVEVCPTLQIPILIVAFKR